MHRFLITNSSYSKNMGNEQNANMEYKNISYRYKWAKHKAGHTLSGMPDRHA